MTSLLSGETLSKCITFPFECCCCAVSSFWSLFKTIWDTFWWFICCCGINGTLISQRCIAPLRESSGKGVVAFTKRLGGYVSTIRVRFFLIDWIFKFCGRVFWIASEGVKLCLGAVGLIPWTFTLVIGWFLWYLFGAWFIILPVYIDAFSQNIDGITSGFVAFANIFLTFQGYINFILNLLRPLLNSASSALMSVVVAFAQTLVVFPNSPAGGGRRNDARELLSGAPEMPPLDFWSPAPEFEQLEIAWNTWLSQFIYALSLVIQIVLVIWKFASVYWRLLIAVFRAISDIGLLSGVCCTKSIGCCLLNLVKGILMSIGITISGCSQKDLLGVPCSCTKAEGGPFEVDYSCRLPSYSCAQAADGRWSETIREEISIEVITPRQGIVGDIEEVVCARSVSNGQQKSTTTTRGRRASEGGGECAESCISQHGGLSFALVKCGDEVFLKGDCKIDGEHRRLEGELWRAHMKKFKKQYASVPVSLKRAPEPQTPNNKERPPRITKEDFIKRIREIEDSPVPDSLLLDGCDEAGGAYEDFAWRTTCLIMKNVAMKIPRGLSLPMKQAGHVWRGLQEGNNFHEILDQISWTHNEHFPDDPVPTDHVQSRRGLEELVKLTHERTLEAVELFKMASLRKLVEEQPVGISKCPGSGKPVPSNRLRDCPPLTDAELLVSGTALDYAVYWVSSLEQQLDPGTLLVNTLQCWVTVLANPETNPGSIAGILNAIKTGKEDQFVYCFPAFAKIPYPGKITFSWNQFVRDQCKAKPGRDGTVLPCSGSQYDDSLNVMNCYDKWTTFAPVCVITRLYNSWIAFQWVITRLPIGWFSGIWATLMSLVGASPAVVNAFSAQQAEGGRSDTLNWLQFFLHLASLIWLLLFILLPGYLALAFFSKPLYGIIVGAGKMVFDAFNWSYKYCWIRSKGGWRKGEKANREMGNLVKNSLSA